ncbi:MAG: glycosyltransferase [Aliihoeflea sp.]|uniref:glycosyltransferase n=1 Tax=Aliihoeflea sp. TaxID=2608088 RepID=UPI004034BA2F
MKTHVLYVGGEDHNLRIPFILAMRDRGFRVSAAGSGDAAPFEAVGITFHPFRFHRFINPLADIASLANLSRLLRELRPDIAQGFDTKPCLYLPMAAGLTGWSAPVRTICGRAWVYSTGSLLAWSMRPVYRLLHRAASRFTAATVFEIEDDRAFFEDCSMAGRNGLVIPGGGGGVDVDGFERALEASPSRSQMRRALGLGNGEIVMTVTRMTRQKGIPTLLNAAAIVHRERPDVRFVLVGPRESEGPLAISQAEIDAHAPYVVALGARSDVPALLRAADLFAFPTEYREGVPRALLEAGLAELPVVATTIPGCRDVVEDGVTGSIVPMGSPEALARGILALLVDKERAGRMGMAAARRARSRYSLEAIADSHARLYNQLDRERRKSLEPVGQLAASEPRL